ncbi:MAG: polyphosphate polymerase domain-containing protein [bacterium]|nr:polyphosphate polymerase domain-containing protein [bacterium]MCM1423694.1 polyphosphate polymerase domain-containing protein [bacterium]
MYCLQRRLEGVLRTDSHENSAGGYSVSSLYFDDLVDSSLTDTIAGNRIRDKYRIRIYNHSLDRIKLEVKEKVDSRVYKKSRTITKEEMQKLIRGERIESLSDREDPATLFNLAIQTRGLRPRTIVTYDRKAFTYDPGNVRITLDRNIKSSDCVERFGDAELSYDFLWEQDAILEMKYDEFIPGFILQLLELGNLQQISYSKYQMCRERRK